LRQGVGSQISRRNLLKGSAVAVGAIAWTAPQIRPAEAATGGSPSPSTSTSIGSGAALTARKLGPSSVAPGNSFEFAVTVTNVGGSAADDVRVVDTLPASGSFVSSEPSGTLDGSTLEVELGTIESGESRVVVVRWSAPSATATLTNRATAIASNASAVESEFVVEVRNGTVLNGAGAVAAGTGLRQQGSGSIALTGIPPGATVTRAVLVWAVTVFRAGSTFDPAPDTIRVNGQLVTADAREGSGTLCWSDENEDGTVGFTADVTSLVTGDGTYTLSDYPANSPELPWTEGASIVVFFTAPGVDNQVFSDFRFSAQVTSLMQRTFSGVAGTGGAATLVLAGPGGQTIFDETVTVTDNGSISFDDTFNGDAGDSWDNDSFDVSSVVPVGSSTLTVDVDPVDDCVGVSVALLVVEQI
jgi:uncharacterized repeat protein (TIGR01451 family)